jgi:hypothetical protein
MGPEGSVECRPQWSQIRLVEQQDLDQIEVKSRIRICIKVKNWVRICKSGLRIRTH